MCSSNIFLQFGIIDRFAENDKDISFVCFFHEDIEMTGTCKNDGNILNSFESRKSGNSNEYLNRSLME